MIRGYKVIGMFISCILDGLYVLNEPVMSEKAKQRAYFTERAYLSS